MGVVKWILELAGLATAVATIIGAVMVTLKGSIWLAHFRDDFFGQDARSGKQAQPGILERTGNTEVKVANIESKVEGLDRGQLHLIDQFKDLKEQVFVVKAALEPDHGGSLFDMVKRLDERFNGEIKS